MTNRILVGAVFLVGCAVGGASSQLVVPKASAQQAAALTKWEYTCISAEIYNETGAVTPTVNKYGAQGWELAIANDWVVCFKRPKM